MLQAKRLRLTMTSTFRSLLPRSIKILALVSHRVGCSETTYREPELRSLRLHVPDGGTAFRCGFRGGGRRDQTGSGAGRVLREERAAGAGDQVLQLPRRREAEGG